MVKRYVLLLWLCMLPSLTQAAVLAQLDRNPVALGDPVVLSFTTDSILNTEPDFSLLQQDFDLAGRSQSTSFSIVNGRQTQTTVWELTLY
ncbi:MAG: BatD family protein, partial [Thiothrix sp.]